VDKCEISWSINLFAGWSFFEQPFLVIAWTGRGPLPKIGRGERMFMIGADGGGEGTLPGLVGFRLAGAFAGAGIPLLFQWAFHRTTGMQSAQALNRVGGSGHGFGFRHAVRNEVAAYAVR